MTDQVAMYEALLAGTKMWISIREKTGLEISDDTVATLGQKVGVTMVIGEQRSAPAKRGVKQPAFAPYPCPACGFGKVYDNRLDKQNPKAPDFKCANRGGCDPDGKGFPWGGWLQGKRGTISVEELFGQSTVEESFSNDALEGEDQLPF